MKMRCSTARSGNDDVRLEALHHGEIMWRNLIGDMPFHWRYMVWSLAELFAPNSDRVN
jgi:hypothetical protein